jgi:nitrite reductase/ring-hydroxylating ferredoxin subunit
VAQIGGNPAALKFTPDPLASAARPAPGVALCPLDEIPVMEARRFLFTAGDDEFRGLVLHTPRGVRGYANWCPHMELPLQFEERALCLEGNVLTCAWHGARFLTTDGRNLTMATGGGLQVWPVVVDAAGVVRTA